jgi:protein SHQ1
LLFEVRYGFAGKYSNVFEKLQREIPNIVDVPSPDHMTAKERHEARCLCEDNSFSPDHYLADLMDNVYLEEAILTYKPHWQKELAKFRKQSKVKVEPLSVCCSTDPVKNKSDILEPNAEIIPFTPKHLDLLKQLPKKEYLLDSEIKREVYLGLVDIMLAYVYNHITCEGENNIESAWTICKLSASLSWLQVFRADLKEVVVTFFRRSLSFPLYRHWSLSQFVLNETRDLFLLGRRKLLVCLLEIHHLFSLSDHFYVLNDIFITDYCVWIQYASSEAIASISEALGKCTVSREEIPWELLELEQAAQLVADEASSDD